MTFPRTFPSPLGGSADDALARIDPAGATRRTKRDVGLARCASISPVDLGRQPWSRFAVFLAVTLLLGVLQREWLLVSVDVLLLGSLAESVLELTEEQGSVGLPAEQGSVGWPTVRIGWPGSYLVWLPIALIVGVAAAYLELPVALLTPALAVAAACLLIAPPDGNQRTLDTSPGRS
ncbi:MAG: hypothetical protein QOJ32_2159 [Frankiaceae bacterium]|nr:hypothetical protein [Frankiaceae bacterium]